MTPNVLVRSGTTRHGRFTVSVSAVLDTTRRNWPTPLPCVMTTVYPSNPVALLPERSPFLVGRQLGLDARRCVASAPDARPNHTSAPVSCIRISPSPFRLLSNTLWR